MKKTKYSNLLRENRELRDTVARLELKVNVRSIPFEQFALERQVRDLEEEVAALKQQNERFKSCTIKGLSRGPLARYHYLINGAKTYVKKYSIKRMRAQGKKLTQQLLEEHYKTIEEDWKDYCKDEYWQETFEQDLLEEGRLEEERLEQNLQDSYTSNDDDIFDNYYWDYKDA